MPQESSSKSSDTQPIPMIDLRAQYAALQAEIRPAIDRVLESQHFVLGPEGDALEQEMAHYAGRRCGIGVASGTDAITLGLRACGIGPRDDVIVPAFTFIATAGAVSALGARPVFADSEPLTLNVDPASVRARITPRTAAIVAVHLFGAPAELSSLTALAAETGLPLIEDNAQSLGATYESKKVGSFGTVSTTSFYPSKNLGAYGDGGMIFTDSEKIAERLRTLRNHGQTGRYVSSEPGWNSRLDELQATVLRIKLRHLDAWIATRRAHAARYTEQLRAVSGVQPLEPPANCEHSYYLYTVRIPGVRTNPYGRRDQVAQHLTELGIGCGTYYPIPLHLQPIYASLGGKIGDLPVAERGAHEVLSLPLYPELTTEQIDRVVDAVEAALRG
jgi:dTDP-4-amino-4,6-dideoxygalactose transaminase